MASRDCYVYLNCLCYNPPRLPSRYLGQAWSTRGPALPSRLPPPVLHELVSSNSPFGYQHPEETVPESYQGPLQ